MKKKKNGNDKNKHNKYTSPAAASSGHGLPAKKNESNLAYANNNKKKTFSKYK